MTRSTAALVTGCSSGIGRATALALVEAGVPTFATARSVDSLASLVELGCTALACDVTDEASMRGASAQDVARVVVKAVTAARPATRYKVTAAARVLPAARVLLPDRVWDRLLRRQFPTHG